MKWRGRLVSYGLPALAGLMVCREAAQAYSWLPPTNKIAVLAVSAHPDDEGIFFGGVLPYYSSVLRVPTMLLCMADSNDRIRQDELRCAAWTYGLRYEPIFGHFDYRNTGTYTNTPYGTNTIKMCWDLWADGAYQGDGSDVEAGKTRAISFVAEQIRRYRPDVILTHDLNGETGHDNHKATAYAVTRAFEVAADPNATAANLVGLPPWQARKLYVHLYPTNRLFHTFWETPYAALTNLTPHQAVNLGLTCHVSQGPERWKCGSVYPPGGIYYAWPSEWWGLYASTAGLDTILTSNLVVNGYTVPAGVAAGDFLEHLSLAALVTCSTNKSVECGQGWAFDAPTVVDPGGTSTLTVLSTTTNGTCGAGYVARQVWQVADAYGNSATCTQVVAVVDTTPPLILGPSNLTVECSSLWDFGTPLAADKGLGGVVVYDNSVNDLVTRFDAGTNEVGNELLLAGPERYLQGFSYEFWSTNVTGSALFEGTNVTVRLRFYANDGPEFNGYPTPGTLLYDSGGFWLGMGTTPRATLIYDEFDLGVYALTPLVVALPSNFTWTVQFEGLGMNDRAGVDLYSPPVVGHSYGDFWLRTNGGWQLRMNPVVEVDMAARARASTNQVVITIVSTVTNAMLGNGWVATRTWRATDACGNSSDCSQTITVVDTTAPVITHCPTNRSLAVGANCLLALPDFTGELMATDSCSGLTVSQSPTAGTQIGLGQHVVAFTASDAASNYSTCGLILTVGPPSGANTNVNLAGRITLRSDGAVQLDFVGLPCASHTLESSTDLANWEVVTTLAASGDGLLGYVDTGATNRPARFFRLRFP